MKDRVPRYPGRVILTPVTGQANTFDMVRADEPTEAGTPLNTASLLTAATSQTLFGNDDDHTVNEALAKLFASKLPFTTIAGVDLNTIKHTGLYIMTAACTNAPNSAWGTIYCDFRVGTPYQLFVTDGHTRDIYKRGYARASDTWSGWINITNNFEILSYVGTGTYGQSNPTSVTFSGTPKLVIISPGLDFVEETNAVEVLKRNTAFFAAGASEFTVAFQYQSGTSYYIGPGRNYITWSGNTISWYVHNYNYPQAQLNESGVTYYAIAIMQ